MNYADTYDWATAEWLQDHDAVWIDQAYCYIRISDGAPAIYVLDDPAFELDPDDAISWMYAQITSSHPRYAEMQARIPRRMVEADIGRHTDVLIEQLRATLAAYEDEPDHEPDYDAIGVQEQYEQAGREFR